jgi:hypothetical protein
MLNRILKSNIVPVINMGLTHKMEEKVSAIYFNNGHRKFRENWERS